jgi:hypothetical protein
MMSEGQKEGDDYSEETVTVKAKKKKEQLDTQVVKGPVVKILEIDLSDIALRKAQREKMVTVRRGNTTYQRRQKVGKKDPDNKKSAKKTAKKKEKTLDIPKMSDINFDAYAESMMAAIDNSGVDTLSDMDENDILYYIEDQTPVEYGLRYGTEKLQNEFEKKLYTAFKSKYMNK